MSIPPPHEKAVTANARTLAGGEALLSKAAEFLGGADKLKSVHDISATEDAEMHTPQGDMTMKVKSEGIPPDVFREEQQRGPLTITLFVDQTSGWVNTPKGTQALPGQAQDQIRSQVSRQFSSLLKQIAGGKDAVLTGDGKVQIKTATGEPVMLAIDPTTGSIASMSYTDDEGPVVESFSDWRDVGGIKLPFKSNVVKNGKSDPKRHASEMKINTNLTAEELGKRP